MAKVTNEKIFQLYESFFVPFFNERQNEKINGKLYLKFIRFARQVESLYNDINEVRAKMLLKYCETVQAQGKDVPDVETSYEQNLRFGKIEKPEDAEKEEELKQRLRFQVWKFKSEEDLDKYSVEYVEMMKEAVDFNPTIKLTFDDFADIELSREQSVSIEEFIS